jgi:Xaa-Pro dipeptidase
MSLDSLFADHIQTLRARTDAALEACGFEALAIFAGRQHMLFLDDQPYPFKANPHFKWWTPLSDPANCWIVYEPQRPLELIFVQPRDYWHKPPEHPSGYWTRHFGIRTVHEPAQARSHVERTKRCAFIGEWQPEFDDWGFVAQNPQPLLDRLHYTRAIKTPYELECMRRASDRGARGHRAAEQAFRRGASEYEIHLDYLRATGHVEPELPYPNIVALNSNAAVLHYQHQGRSAPQRVHTLLIDAGAEFAGYACDITRTYAHADDRFAALIRSMDQLQQGLCEEVRAGVDYSAIHLSAHTRIAGLLKEAGVIDLDPGAAVESGLSSVFFPHGIGHLLGLQVHDVAGLNVSPDGTQKARPAGHPYLRLTRSLEPGFVVTIEPGIYFIDMLLQEARASKHARHIDWKLVDELMPYGGIRIEDNVACTAAAPENLTRAAFARAATAAA